MTSPAPSAPGGFLRIEDVVKDFGGGAVAVNHVSVDIAKGEIFALLGSSGCGKTTLLRMLAGFETPTSGRIVLDGRDLAGLPPYARPLNMMFQSYALFPHLTVWDNIAFGLRRDRLGRPPRWPSGSTRCSSWCSWASTASASRTSCRAASSSAWRWRAAWRRSPSCCCSTNPWARSTRSCARKPRSSWSTSSKKSA